jgi:putative ABC transport system permease protein
VISVATAVISGLWPALQTSKVSLTEALKESGHQSSSSRRSRFLRDLLVVLQVAFTFVLLIGAGLMTNSFARLYNVEPGFNTQNLLTMLVSLPRGEKDDPEKWSAFWTEAIARSQNVPGVLGAAVVNPLPLSDTPFGMYVSRADGASTNHDERFQVLYSTISNDYFHLMGIPLRGGRYFHDSDRADSSPVVIVNEAFVRLYLSNQEQGGERLIVDRGAKRERSAAIIGVVADSKSRLDEQIRPHIYLSVLQSPQPSMYVVTRTATEASGFALTMRNLILEMDKNQPVGRVRTMKAIRAEYMVRPRFYLTLLASFALVATLLAASGIYGIFSHTLTQRTHEIGIRMALGARTSDVMSMIIVQGMKLTLLGLAAGLIGAFTLTGSIKNWIFGVSVTDPLTFITVALVLAGVALGACFVPARRATKVDPMVALRYE